VEFIDVRKQVSHGDLIDNSIANARSLKFSRAGGAEARGDVWMRFVNQKSVGAGFPYGLEQFEIAAEELGAKAK